MRHIVVLCCLSYCGVAVMAQTRNPELIRQIETLQAKEPHAAALPALYRQLQQAPKQPDDWLPIAALFEKAYQHAETTFVAEPTEANGTAYVARATPWIEINVQLHRWTVAEHQLQRSLTLVQKLNPPARALAEARLGHWRMELAWCQLHYDQAATHGTALVKQWAELHAAAPTSATIAHERALCLHHVARVDLALGRISRAEKHLGAAMGLAQRQHDATPTDDATHELLCQCAMTLAYVKQDTGHYLAAEQAYLDALRIAERWQRAIPDAKQPVRALGTIWHHLESLSSPNLSTSAKRAYAAQADAWRRKHASGSIDTDIHLADSIGAMRTRLLTEQAIPTADPHAYSTQMQTLMKQYPTIPMFAVQFVHTSTLILVKDNGTIRQADALQAFGEAIAVVRELHRTAPTVPLYEYMVVTHEGELIGIDLQAGKNAVARQRYQQQQQAWATVLKKYPENGLLRHKNALTNLAIASYASAAKDHTFALDIYHDSLARLQECVLQFPDEVYFRRHYAEMLEGLAALYQNNGDKVNTLKSLQTTVAAWERLCKDNPTVPDYALAHINMRTHLGQMLNDLERYREAVTEYTAAVQLAQQWTKAKPEYRFFGERSGLGCAAAAKAALNNGQTAQAIAWQSQAIQEQAELIKQQPTAIAHYTQLREFYKERALLHLRQGHTMQYDTDYQKADELERMIAQLEMAQK